jgi:hypothetical protein
VQRDESNPSESKIQIWNLLYPATDQVKMTQNDGVAQMCTSYNTFGGRRGA